MRSRNQSRTFRRRRGNVIFLALFFMVVMLGCLAFAIDIGTILAARTELQRSADSAALAAAWDLIDEGAFDGDANLTAAISSARATAADYASYNAVRSDAPAVDQNLNNLADGDVVVGYLADPSSAGSALDLTDPSVFNAVKVRVQRTNQQNGEIGLFFARIFGITQASLEADATAVVSSQISGFQIPYDGSNVGILPFALDEDTWNDLVAGNTDDDWSWDEATQTITSGGDGILEANLYPQGTGSPGNRGTVDIGSSNNSTNDIARQIVHGASKSDLAYHGGSVELDSNGELFLNGDTGISAGVKDELASIKGEPRVIPIFRTVTGPGNNAVYKIVKFVGIRIMDVKLTGPASKKYVMIQPAVMATKGAIPTTEVNTSDLVFTPAYLVR